MAIGHLVYMFLLQQPDCPRYIRGGGGGTEALSFTHGSPCLDAGSTSALWPGVTDAGFYFTEAPLLTPALTSEQSPGGGPGNWFHPALIFSGEKGKVINIFYL